MCVCVCLCVCVSVCVCWGAGGVCVCVLCGRCAGPCAWGRWWVGEAPEENLSCFLLKPGKMWSGDLAVLLLP